MAVARKSPRTDLKHLLKGAPALQTQQLTVTILGTHGRGGRLVWSGGLVKTLSEFGFSKGASRVALGRLVQRDLLTRLKHGRLVYYALTKRSEALMREGDRRIFHFGQSKREVDVWTLVWYAIPDSRRLERTRLARRLRFLGFGSLQDGTWVAPHNVEAETVRLLKEAGVADYSGLIVGPPAKELDHRVLVRRAWDLESLAARYRSFLDAFRPLAENSAQITPRSAFVASTVVAHFFREFPSLDPELPDDEFGVAGLRAQVADVFDELFHRLEAGARQHFDALQATE